MLRFPFYHTAKDIRLLQLECFVTNFYTTVPPFFNAVFLLLRGVQLRRNVYLISELFRGSLSLIHTHHCLNLHYISPRCESLTQQSFTSYLGRLK
jgi:hypothetical protein